MTKVFDNPILMVLSAGLTTAVLYYLSVYFFGTYSPILTGMVSGCFVAVHWYRNYFKPDKFKGIR